ncbi:MAG: hypothetical protein U9O53_02240, partial [archaeon]|nr:hypothetical protein [archaeon]
GASSTIPMQFTNFVVIKQFVIAYIILLLADVLLNLGPIRRLFRLEEKSNQTNTGYIIGAALLLGVLFWFIDSAVGSLVFYNERSFLELLALDIPPYVLYVRTAFILTCLVGGWWRQDSCASSVRAKKRCVNELWIWNAATGSSRSSRTSRPMTCKNRFAWYRAIWSL